MYRFTDRHVDTVDLVNLLLFFENRESGLKIDLREIGCGAVDWINVVQDRDQWRALVKLSGYIECCEILGLLSN
jgi:hypothetical protein